VAGVVLREEKNDVDGEVDLGDRSGDFQIAPQTMQTRGVLRRKEPARLDERRRPPPHPSRCSRALTASRTNPALTSRFNRRLHRGLGLVTLACAVGFLGLGRRFHDHFFAGPRE
jgi:hypothetical protein